MKKYVLLLFVFSIALLNCKKTRLDPLPVITFSTPALSCVYGNTGYQNLATSTIPYGGSIRYSIDNSDVAEVNEKTGEVTPKMEGSAIVTATQFALKGHNQEATGTYSLTVSAPVSVLKFGKPGNDTCVIGYRYFQNTVVTSQPAGGKITYSANNPAVATVDPVTGYITPLAEGTAIVTATQEASLNINQKSTATYTLIVIAPKPKLVFSTQENFVCEMGRKGCVNQAKSSIPSGGAISYSVENPAVAEIDPVNGTIKPISVGTTKVTATQAAKHNVNSKAAASYSLTINPVAILLSADTYFKNKVNAEKSFQYPGGTIYVKVSTGVLWTAVSDNPTWCTIKNSAGNGDGSIVLTCAPNNSTAWRTAMITVSGPGGNPKAILKITQWGRPPNPYLRIQDWDGQSSANLTVTVNGPGTYRFNVISNVSWGVTHYTNGSYFIAQKSGDQLSVIVLKQGYTQVRSTPQISTITLTAYGGSPVAHMNVYNYVY